MPKLLTLLLLAPFLCIGMAAGAEDTSQWSFKAIGRGVVEVEGGIIQLSAKKDGVVKEVLVEEGDKVSKGQILAVQDDSVAIPNLELARADVKQQQAQLETLKAQMLSVQKQAKRLRPLVDIEVEPAYQYEELQDRLNELNKQLETAKIAVEIAKKRVLTSESDLEQFKIRAPMDGTIVKRLARPGVGASTLSVSVLFWLAPDMPKQVRLPLESKYYGTVREGDRTLVYSVIDENRQYVGRVAKLGKILAPKSATLDNINDPYEDKYFECVIAFDVENDLLIGQNVIVKFRDAPLN